MSANLVVHCSFPNLELAEEIASALIAARLAACVSLTEKSLSIYRWEGEVCKEREVTALIKTREARYPELMSMILRMHSYSCPEIIAVPITMGHKPYLDWIGEETQPPSAP